MFGGTTIHSPQYNWDEEEVSLFRNCCAMRTCKNALRENQTFNSVKGQLVPPLPTGQVVRKLININRGPSRLGSLWGCTYDGGPRIWWPTHNTVTKIEKQLMADLRDNFEAKMVECLYANLVLPLLSRDNEQSIPKNPLLHWHVASTHLPLPLQPLKHVTGPGFSQLPPLLAILQLQEK